MQWASAISEAANLPEAISEVSAAIDFQPDLLVVFASRHRLGGAESIAPALAGRFPDALIVGCSGAGIIGAGREVEARPALSLTAAKLPGVRLLPFHLDMTDLPQDLAAAGWRSALP